MIATSEVFHSTQGESSFRGRSCIFFRTSGCNLQCSFCDSKYALEVAEYLSHTIALERILDLSVKHKTHLVELTGSEPLLQRTEIELLTQSLLNKNFTVLIETNGSMPLLPINNPNLHHIVDIKPPSSGMADKMFWGIFGQLTPTDELKFVIADDNDVEHAIKIIREYNPNHVPILISPVWTQQVDLQAGEARFQKIRMAVADINENIIYQPQLHKIIWGPTKRGV